MSMPSATATTFQIGTYNYNTDTWTTVLDLNDKSNWYIEHGGLSITLPSMEYAESTNIRYQGINVARSQYNEMHVGVSLRAQGGSVATVLSNIHALFQAIDQPPYFIRIAMPGSSAFRYVQVVKRAYSKVPADPLKLVQKLQSGFQVDFTCQPGFMQGRQILHNLQSNPGAEAPSGPAVSYLQETFTNFNDFSIQAGGALTQDVTLFPDVVRAQYGQFNLLHYLRLDEPSGTLARDACATGNNGTISATGITYGTTAILNGDSDKAMGFTGASSGNITVPASGLQTGTATWSYGFNFQLASVSGALQYGLAGGTNISKQGFYMGLNTSNIFQGGVIGTNIAAGGAISTGVRHQGILSWDGTTLQLFLDGASVGTATPGALSITFGSPGAWIGSFISGANFWTGIIKDVWMASGATTATGTGGTASAAALWSAVNSSPPANTTTMVIPNGGRVSYGSPAWSSYNPLLIPFRWATGATFTFFLHRTDANNYLACTMTGTTLSLVNVVGGSTTTISSNASVNLVNGVQYLLALTQFPGIPLLTSSGGTTPPGPQVQAVLYINNNTTLGTTLATLAGSMVDAFLYPAGFPTTAAGQPQLAASGAALALGGLSTRLTASGFGPGTWQMTNNLSGSATGLAVGVWEQQIANNYPSGPVTSYGSLRIDCPPAGTVSAQWTGGGQGVSISQTGIPCTQTQQLGVKAWVKAPSIGNACTIALIAYEYDTSGSQLATATVTTSTGPLSTWTAISGTYTVSNSGTVFAVFAVRVTDTNAGASANAIIWIDNIQVWNKTTTGQTSMPFCDTRGLMTAGQIVLSGIMGDMPTQAFIAISTYSSGGLASNGYVQGILGRRATPSTAGILVHPAYATGYDATITPVVDSTAYGGVTIKTVNGSDLAGAFQQSAPQLASAVSGSFNLLTRAEVTGAASNGTSVKMNAAGIIPTVLVVGNVSYLTTTPFSANSTWTHVDLGAVAAAPGKPSNLANLNTTDWEAAVGSQIGTSTQTGFGNYLALMPTDAETHRWRLVNGTTAYSTPWNQVYLDGTNGSTTWTTNSNCAMLYSDALVGGSAAYITSVLPNGDATPMLNPGNSGLNQYTLVALDQAGVCLPYNVEVIYWPRDEWPG